MGLTKQYTYLDFGHSCGVAERIGPRALANGSGVLFGRVGAVMLPKSARARSHSARRPVHRRRSGAVWGTTRRPRRVAVGEPRGVRPAV